MIGYFQQLYKTSEMYIILHVYYSKILYFSTKIKNTLQHLNNINILFYKNNKNACAKYILKLNYCSFSNGQK